MDDRVHGADRGEEDRVDSTSSTSVERVMVPLMVEAMADSRAARVW